MQKAAETQLVPYDLDTAIIEGLKSKYMDVTIPAGDKAAYAFVMGGLKDCRERRLECDDWHKGKKAKILKAGKHYDGEKKRVHALIEPIESKLKAERKVEDDRVEAIRLEKEQVERERVEGIMAKIESFALAPYITPAMSATNINVQIERVANIGITNEEYMEFADTATAALQKSLSELNQLLADRIAWEKEQEDQKTESKRLADQKAEQDAAQAKIDEDNRKIDEKAVALAKEDRRIEKEKKAEADKKEREAFEKETAEKARIKAEQDAIENARQKAEEAEALAAVEEEKAARQEELKPDKEKLIAFADELFNTLGPLVKDVAANEILTDCLEKTQGAAIDLKHEAEEL